MQGMRPTIGSLITGPTQNISSGSLSGAIVDLSNIIRKLRNDFTTITEKNKDSKRVRLDGYLDDLSELHEKMNEIIDESNKLIKNPPMVPRLDTTINRKRIRGSDVIGVNVKNRIEQSRKALETGAQSVQTMISNSTPNDRTASTYGDYDLTD
jgi:hypothetical protein